MAGKGGAGEVHDVVCPGTEDHPCGKTFQTNVRGTKRLIRCPECRKEAQAQQTKESEYRIKHSVDKNSSVNKKEAYKVMEDLGIKTQAVQNVLWEKAVSIAESKGITPMLAFFRHGPHYVKALEDWKEENEVTPTTEELKVSGLISIQDVPAEPVEGELLNARELFALASFYLWPYEDSDLEDKVRFDAYKKLRYACKTDIIALGTVLGKNFQPKPHGEWADFFPHFEPTLKPDYSEKDIESWLAQQTSKSNYYVRDYLLMCARNHYKTTFSIAWSLTAVLCCPDIRILLCSSTQKMAQKFMNLFQSYWIRKGGGDEGLRRFQRLFPEYMVAEKDTREATFTCPMHRLIRVDTTAQITSLETGDTGSRFDIMLGDDVIHEEGSRNLEQREKAINNYDEKRRFREAGVGFVITIGTPKHPEDLYAALVKRAEGGESIAMHIASAWVVKSPWRELVQLPKNHPQRLDIHLLKEDMVDVLFPGRSKRVSTFDWLMSELGTTAEQERSFRSEYLIEWISGESDEVLAFNEEKLNRALVIRTSIPEGETILTFDTAESLARYADNSALTALRKVMIDGRWVVFVLDQDAGKWDIDAKAEAVARFSRMYNPGRVVIELSSTYNMLLNKIYLTCNAYQQSIPTLIPVPVDNSKNAKFMRVKACADLIPDQLRFANGGSQPFIEPLFAEARRLDGKGTKMTSRNDRWDSIALGIRFWKKDLERLPLTPEQQKIEAAVQLESYLRGSSYIHIFGESPIDQANRDAGNWEGREMFRVYQNTGEIVKDTPVVEQVPVKPADPRSAPVQAAIQKIFGAGSPYRA